MADVVFINSAQNRTLMKKCHGCAIVFDVVPRQAREHAAEGKRGGHSEPGRSAAGAAAASASDSDSGAGAGAGATRDEEKHELRRLKQEFDALRGLGPAYKAQRQEIRRQAAAVQARARKGRGRRSPQLGSAGPGGRCR